MSSSDATINTNTNIDTNIDTNINTNIEIINDFGDLDLKRNLLRGIYSFGFENPSKIQAKAIKPMIEKKELIAQSHSGTGKTGAFMIATLQIIDETFQKCQAIIITPTHELATQIYDVSQELAKFMNIKFTLCIGKTNIIDNKRDLETSVVAIGTPGRINDLINRKTIDTNYIKLLVLDEADEMLSNDFCDQIKTTIGLLPKNTQICLFSATMPDETLEITKAFLQNPTKILIENEKLTLDEISQFYHNTNVETSKYEIFKEIYNLINVGQIIVYVNTQHKAQQLYEQLTSDNHTCGVIYSHLDSHSRTTVLKQFRNGVFRILISTDLLARGIDIQKLSVVINYDIPFNKECYIHRIGRSGRFGKRGVAINLVTNNDIKYLKDIERHYKTSIQEMPENINFYI